MQILIHTDKHASRCSHIICKPGGRKLFFFGISMCRNFHEGPKLTVVMMFKANGAAEEPTI